MIKDFLRKYVENLHWYKDLVKLPSVMGDTNHKSYVEAVKANLKLMDFPVKSSKSNFFEEFCSFKFCSIILGKEGLRNGEYGFS